MHLPPSVSSCSMSDLALPFLLLFEDDALAFWCFEKLMRKVSRAAAIAAGLLLLSLCRVCDSEHPPLLPIADPSSSFSGMILRFQVRRNFAVEPTGIFAQLGRLASILEKVDPILHNKLQTVGAE